MLYETRTGESVWMPVFLIKIAEEGAPIGRERLFEIAITNYGEMSTEDRRTFGLYLDDLEEAGAIRIYTPHRVDDTVNL